MNFGTTEQMGIDLLKMTATMASHIGGTSPKHAAKKARETMAALLGLDSIGFELTQRHGTVEGIEISFELKETAIPPIEFVRGNGHTRRMAETTCGTPSMASMADGEAKPIPNERMPVGNPAAMMKHVDDPEFDGQARKAIDESAARAPRDPQGDETQPGDNV